MSKQMNRKSEKSVKKAIVHVLGCKVNQAEAAAMARILEDRGYQVDSDTRDPDLVLVNTCCVTAKAEGKSRRAVGRLAQRFPNARIVVTGCLAEVNPASLEGVGNDTLILGTYDKDHFDDFADQAAQPGSATHRYPHPNPLPEGERAREFGSQDNGEPITNRHTGKEDSGKRAPTRWGFNDLGAPGIPERARAFLKVQDGCNQQCTYCIVPAARGRSRSLEPEKALAHARTLSQAGYAEIVLTGIHLGSYGRDLNPAMRLEDLAEELLQECPRVRFRMSSIEPQEISPRLIDQTARYERLCSHFHIPLQSGDDEILKRMKRPYTASAVRLLTRTILEKVPDACIGFDVMVGFPGEDEHSFRRTVDLLLSSQAAYLHVFPFSPRPGTPAADFRPRVSAANSQQRVAELRTVSKKLRSSFYSRFIGRTMSAVLESEAASPDGTVIARTDNYIPVRIRKSDHIPTNRAFLVTLKGLNDVDVFGSLADVQE